MLFLFILFTLVDVFLSAPVNSDQIYTTLSQSHPCVVILSKNGAFGCRTLGEKVNGVVRLGLTSEDIQNIQQNPPTDKIALLLGQSLFNKETLNQLQDSFSLAGIMVAYSDTKPDAWSPGDRSPQADMRLHKSRPAFEWNPLGNSMYKESYPFAIISLSELETSVMLNRANHNEKKNSNGEYSPYHVEFRYSMAAEQDSSYCLEAGQCLPVGGYSIWGSFGEIDKTDTEKHFILASTAIDSSAFFHTEAYGANAGTSGTVVLLAAATALAKIEGIETLPKQLLFAFFNGESYSYVGSRKFVDDILHFDESKCEEKIKDGKGCKIPYKPDLEFTNINLTNIDRMLDLRQLGLNSTVFMHRDIGDNIETDAFIEEIKTIAQLNKTSISVKEAATDTDGIPPSSAMAFLTARSDLPAIVLTDHYREYANKYYHSRFDDSDNVISNQKIKSQIENLRIPATPELCAIATLVARILYASAGNFSTTSFPPEILSISADCAEVAELFYCITQNFNCNLVKKYGTTNVKLNNPQTVYTSVYQPTRRETIEGVPRFYKNYLKAALSKRSGDVFFHDAVDPLLQYDYHQSKWHVPTNLSSTLLWTESNWNIDIGSRSYVAEAPIVEKVMLISGLTILVMSTIVVHFSTKICKKRYKRL